MRTRGALEKNVANLRLAELKPVCEGTKHNVCISDPVSFGMDHFGGVVAIVHITSDENPEGGLYVKQDGRYTAACWVVS